MAEVNLREEKKYLGSCVCGQVKYEIDAKITGFYLCHCSRCQKTSGSSNAANAFSKEAKLRWISGETNQKMFNLPGTRFTRNFCIDCGSYLPYEINDLILIPVGSLDTDIDITPMAHIFYASKASWEKNLEQIEKRDEFIK